MNEVLSETIILKFNKTSKTCHQIKDLLFRVFDNPPVVDILKTIACDLLLC